ncbi:hypothetical protein Ahy_B08g093043 [Arachis hypogaea]|uniref:Uncharacterized protein n=1 Tax=Arachis hypogaea TaxID=3818 RepID=A0A444Y5B3_ARAHY|nr:hypothetical protein Ahy_B08g093043 [Arachis hypogaea]
MQWTNMYNYDLAELLVQLQHPLDIYIYWYHAKYDDHLNLSNLVEQDNQEENLVGDHENQEQQSQSPLLRAIAELMELCRSDPITYSEKKVILIVKVLHVIYRVLPATILPPSVLSVSSIVARRPSSPVFVLPGFSRTWSSSPPCRRSLFVSPSKCLHWYTLLWHIFWGALKHVNGIEGRSTMVVRVIACFQPLHNCQLGVANGPKPAGPARVTRQKRRAELEN